MPTQLELENATTELRQTAAEIVAAKRPVYTNDDEDVLWNFKLISEITGLTVGQVMAVYTAKQFIAICRNIGKPTSNDSERATRIPDAVNYLELVNVGEKVKELDQVGF